ncbi:hypothetical protein [Chryseobacterium sp. Mn2064]|uniref:hypothetical protein n=1 Tax=Chryseobacterium sp. Mn2064 TaxID=3395263 RepID=UPI003BE62D08
MGKEIFKRLLYPFLFSLGLSFLIVLLVSGGSGGSENTQARNIMFFYASFISISCFISSVPAFLNLVVSVRKSLYLSIASFFAFPLAVHIFTILQNTEGDLALLIIFYSPSSLYLLALIYNFYRFRKNTEIEWIQKNL